MHHVSPAYNYNTVPAMRPGTAHKVTSAPPSTPDVEENNTSEDDTGKEFDEHFSSPDIWDSKVHILETSTSDIFDEDDSEDDLIEKRKTPDAAVSEEEDLEKTSNLYENSPESISIKTLEESDSVTSNSKVDNSSTEATPPTGLLKVNSSSPEYLDLYSQDVFDVNTITVEKFYESRSTQGSENTFLSDLKMRPKTCYKLQDMSVFNISSEVDQVLLPKTNVEQSAGKEDLKLPQKKVPVTKKNSVLENLENMFYIDEEGR